MNKDVSAFGLVVRAVILLALLYFVINTVYPQFSIGGRIEHLVNTGWEFSHREVVSGEYMEVWNRGGQECYFDINMKDRFCSFGSFDQVKYNNFLSK